MIQSCHKCKFYEQVSRFNVPPFGRCRWTPGPRPFWYNRTGGETLFENDGKTCEVFKPIELVKKINDEGFVRLDPQPPKFTDCCENDNGTELERMDAKANSNPKEPDYVNDTCIYDVIPCDGCNRCKRDREY